MSFSFAVVTLAKDGPATIETAVEMGLAAKLFKMMGNRSIDDLNAKVVVAVRRPHWDINHLDATSRGTEFLKDKLPREIALVGIMDRGGQIRLDGAATKSPYTAYITCHHDGRVEAMTQPGQGDALPGPLPPINPADRLAEGTLARRIVEWYQSGDTGVSAETMCYATLGGAMPRKTGYPNDPADLGRCIRFLEKFPEARAELSALRWMEGRAILAHQMHRSQADPEYTNDDVWGELLDHWDELTALYLEELPQGCAPKCYARMKELIRSVETPVKPAAPRG
jgi:hypothetical protein